MSLNRRSSKKKNLPSKPPVNYFYVLMKLGLVCLEVFPLSLQGASTTHDLEQLVLEETTTPIVTITIYLPNRSR